MPTTISVLGQYNTGKRTILSAFTGIERDKLKANSQSRWISQIKGTKDDITLQGLPEEHGRMSAFRQRNRAINESKAFVAVVRNSKAAHYEFYYETVTKNLIDGKTATMGPWLIIAGYITDEVPEADSGVAEWAQSIGARVELLNITKLSNKDESEVNKLDSIIRSFAESIPAATKPVPVVSTSKTVPALPQVPIGKKRPLPKKETSTAPEETPSLSQATPAPTLSESSPSPVPPVQAQPAKKKEDQPIPVKVEPKPGMVSRALDFIVRGGSVA